MNVSGKVVLVTGGAGSLGAMCATRLRHEGATVYLSDLSMDAPPGAQPERYLRHDVTAAADWRAVTEQIALREGRIDVLVHCAGIEGGSDRRGLDATEADWTRVLTVNLTGSFLACQAILPVMLGQRSGSIILLSSANADMATPQALAYGASKAGVAHLARSVAMLGSAGGAQVRCNSVHPGAIVSEMSDRMIAAIADAAGVPTSSIEDRFKTAIPLARRGHAQDVASIVLYLASDESHYTTASAFKVDGGWSMKSAG